MSHEDPMMRFSRAFRAWARKPPDRSAHEARAQVISALERRRSATLGLRPRLALSAALLTTVVLLFGLWPVSQPPEIESVEAPVTERFLVVTLASGNRLYVQLSSPTPRSPRP